ncbi:hypothetical protein T439DRAFT_325155 [Meredithblackwellia eburnea MCA 4105]
MMRVQDNYHGFNSEVKLTLHIINTLFRLTTDTGPSLKRQDRSFKQFVAYVLYRTQLPSTILYHSLLLLTRLHIRYPTSRCSPQVHNSPHRLFLSSYILSSKMNMDNTYHNTDWKILGKHAMHPAEVMLGERELFAFLGWSAHVKKEELDDFINRVVVPFEHALQARESRRLRRGRSPAPSTSDHTTTPIQQEDEEDSRTQECFKAAHVLLHGTSPTASDVDQFVASSSSDTRSRSSLSKARRARPQTPYYASSSPRCSLSPQSRSASLSPRPSFSFEDEEAELGESWTWKTGLVCRSGRTTPGTPPLSCCLAHLKGEKQEEEEEEEEEFEDEFGYLHTRRKRTRRSSVV